MRRNVRLFDPLEFFESGDKRAWSFDLRSDVRLLNERKVNWELELGSLGSRVVEEGVEIKSGRRTLFLRETQDIEGKNKTADFMKEIRERVRTSYYMRHSFQFTIVNTRDGRVMNWWIDCRESERS